jgi:hypothetical protein
MKSAGKSRSNGLPVLERVVPLREGHRARVVPDVDHLGRAPHGPGAPARRRTARYSSMNGRCGSNGSGSSPDALAQLREGADELQCAGRGRTPTPGAACPSSGCGRSPSPRCSRATRRTARPHLRRVPADLRVVRQQLVAHRGGADEPGVARHVEQRAAAAPAVRVGVRLPREERKTCPRSFSSHQVGVRLLDEHARRPAAGARGRRRGRPPAAAPAARAPAPSA